MAADSGSPMTRRIHLTTILTLTIVTGSSGAAHTTAENSNAFTVDEVLSYPFPTQVVAASAGGAVAWVWNERGVRNIYVTQGPEVAARRLTSYDADDGQELSQLTFSDDGQYVVYVRGGEHDGGELPAAARPPNPAASAVEPRVQVWATATASGTPRLVGEGDGVAVAPRSHRVAWVQNGRLWVGSLEGSPPAEAVAINGASGAPSWSPDGRLVAFESRREGHTMIALWSETERAVRYVAPSTGRDSAPVWSPDGRQMAFVRQPGRTTGKAAGAFEREAWAIWVAEVATGAAREVWKSGGGLVDSLLHGAGGANVRWAAGDRLIFLSGQDGWPHLYAVPTAGGTALLLTPGLFLVEHLALTPDRRTVVYSANTGADRDDVDRRHLFTVGVEGGTPAALTSGRGLEWQPVVTSDGRSVAYLGAEGRRPPRPMIVPLAGGVPRELGEGRVPAAFPTAALIEPEAVTVRTEGTRLRGQLFKSAQGPARRPAVVFVHGGPAQQMLLGWHYLEYYAHAYAINQYLAQRGFVVLAVNYRLGIGYGHAFQSPDELSRGETPEYDDVLAAAKYLQARPDVDPLRIGVWGGSYGGYLTGLALIRSSEVFAAGVDVHGVHDRLIRDVEATVFPTLDDMSDPMPIWSSPVLLIHGDDDRTVSFQQTIDLENRLRDKGATVNVEVIPDDVHDFLRFSSWKRVAAATAAFLEEALLNRSR